MKKFIKSLLLILGIVWVADRVTGTLLGYFYTTATTTDEYKINSVISNIESPVVFMGSSRCHHHYIPAVIGDTLQTDVYNAGLWGMRNIYFQYGLLCNMLERYTPQVIVLEIHPVDYLQTSFSDIERVGNLAPFVHRSAGGDEVLKEAGLYYKCILSNTYRYNSEFAAIVLGNLVDRSSKEEKGYKELTGMLDTVRNPVEPETFSLPRDEKKIRYMQKFMDVCREKKIQLLFVYSPMYATNEYTEIFLIPEDLSRTNEIPFINLYDLDGMTGHAVYFADHGHLNRMGAQKYSSIIASILKQYIKSE